MTDSSSTGDLTTKDRIQILLTEHSTLRTEMLNRTNHGFQLMTLAPGFLAGVLTWIAQRPTDANFWIILPAILALISFLVFVGMAGWFTWRDINKAAARVREIEAEVNRRANDKLLQWESRWGGAVTGYWGKASPLS